MKRILFVDDEPLILASLAAVLRPQRKRWDMHFVSSGWLALVAWEAAPFDVVVSDIRMPGMDGVGLLTLLRARAPGLRCLLLSGHADLALLARARPPCDRILNKPCRAVDVVAAIDSLGMPVAEASA